MSAVSTAAVVGAGATAYSAYQNAQRDSPDFSGGSRARPRDVSGLLGDVTFDEEGNATIEGTPELNQAMGGLFGAGSQFLQQGTQQATQDFSDLRQDELDLLRELERPQEEQAAASTASRLFNQGSLGSTGGAEVMGRLAESQEQADIQRQLQAIELARQQQQQGQQMAQLGSGLFGSATSLGQAPLQQANIGINTAAQQSNAALQGARLQQQGELADRQFYGNLLGSGAQVAGGALMGQGGAGTQQSLSSGGLFNTNAGTQQTAMLANQQQGFGSFGAY